MLYEILRRISGHTEEPGAVVELEPGRNADLLERQGYLRRVVQPLQTQQDKHRRSARREA